MKLTTFFKGNAQTVLLKKNIICSVGLKCISILISFQVVPLTIDFVNPTQYGVWLTLSSLMSWFFFFDIGLTNGFRNRFAEAKALGDITKARILVSTTYASLFILFIVMMCVILPINHFLNWSEILNLETDESIELGKVFILLVTFFGLNIVFQVFSTLLTADQRPAFSSLIQVSGQLAAFIALYILTHTLRHGTLTQLAMIFSGVPVAVLLIYSFILFSTRYRQYRPSFHLIRFSYVRIILGIGSKFFVITTSMLFIFQLMNVIISRELGPETVTQYNISYKYFNILYMVALLILNPFWSAFTDAYTRKDFAWMKDMVRKLERLWLVSIPCTIILLLCAPAFYKLWINDSVMVPAIINISVAIYISILILSNIYMHLINGTGKIQIQLIIYVSFAVIAYPTMSFMCHNWGIPGLLVLPFVVYVMQGVLGHMQIRKLLSQTATGLWDK